MENVRRFLRTLSCGRRSRIRRYGQLGENLTRTAAAGQGAEGIYCAPSAEVAATEPDRFEAGPSLSPIIESLVTDGATVRC